MKDLRLFLLIIVSLSLAGYVHGGFCKTGETYTEFGKKHIDLIIFEFEIPFLKKFPRCCQGYSGKECNQLTEDCRRDANCRGQWCLREQRQLCQVEEPMEQWFMGVKTRTVNKLSNKTTLVEVCCAGFSGSKCSQKKQTDLLKIDEENVVRQELTSHEGNEPKIYMFDGSKKFGIGHVVKKEEPEFDQNVGTPVSRERIEDAFDADLHIAMSDVASLFEGARAWPSNAKRVAVDIMFNTKIKKFKQMEGFTMHLTRKNWKNAAVCLLQSKWAKSVGKRADDLANILQNVPGDISDTHGISCIEKADTEHTETSDVDSCNAATEDTGVTEAPGAMFSDWSNWSDCTFKCSGGITFYQTRSRSCESPESSATATGKICDENITETGSKCNKTLKVGDDNDYLCKCKSGKCQYDTTSCESGLHQSGLCKSNSATNYRCCLPKAEKLNCPNEWAKYYACQLKTSGVGLEIKDGKSNLYSSPNQNIKDACAGKSASRSYYTDGDCKDPGSPGGEVCLTATLLKFIFDVNEKSKKDTATKKGIYVTSLAGSNHVCTSHHYMGKGLDIRSVDSSNTPLPLGVKDWIKNKCLYVKGEYVGGYADNHIHCAVDEKGLDVPCEQMNGICQDNSTTCHQPYKTGHCAGVATRQCCVWTYEKHTLGEEGNNEGSSDNEGTGDSTNTNEGTGDSNSDNEGTGDSSNTNEGTGDSNSDNEGTGESNSDNEGTGDGSSDNEGTGDMFSVWSDWSKCTFTCLGNLQLNQTKSRTCEKPVQLDSGKVCNDTIMETGDVCDKMAKEGDDKDYLCKCKSGKCQYNNTACDSGLYQSGLCKSNSATNYRCCLPKAEKLNCPNEWAKYYACQLINPEVGLETKDGSSHLFSSPNQNIKDACAGKSASRSYYTDKDCADPGSPGGEVCLTGTLLKFIYDVNEKVKNDKDTQKGIYVTSLAGSNHGCTSHHFKGKAVDMRSKDSSVPPIQFPAELISRIRDACEATPGGFYTDDYTDKHIHCQADRYDKDFPCEQINGICQDNSTACNQPYKARLCGGASPTRQCCIWTYK